MKDGHFPPERAIVSDLSGYPLSSAAASFLHFLPSKDSHNFNQEDTHTHSYHFLRRERIGVTLSKLALCSIGFRRIQCRGFGNHVFFMLWRLSIFIVILYLRKILKAARCFAFHYSALEIRLRNVFLACESFRFFCSGSR